MLRPSERRTQMWDWDGLGEWSGRVCDREILSLVTKTALCADAMARVVILFQLPRMFVQRGVSLT